MPRLSFQNEKPLPPKCANVAWRWVNAHCDPVGLHGVDQCRRLLACEVCGHGVAVAVGCCVSLPFSELHGLPFVAVVPFAWRHSFHAHILRCFGCTSQSSTRHNNAPPTEPTTYHKERRPIRKGVSCDGTNNAPLGVTRRGVLLQTQTKPGPIGPRACVLIIRTSKKADVGPAGALLRQNQLRCSAPHEVIMTRDDGSCNKPKQHFVLPDALPKVAELNHRNC